MDYQVKGYEKYNNKLIPLNIAFFAGGDSGEKTEKPTSKRRTDSRKEGQVAKSTEVGTTVIFIVGFASLGFLGQYMYNRLQALFLYNIALQREYMDIFEPVFLADYVFYAFLQVILTALPMLLIVMISGLIVNILY